MLLAAVRACSAGAAGVISASPLVPVHAQAGGLPPLLELMASRNGNLQHNAAFALYGLADNEDNIAAIVRQGGVQALQDCELLVQVPRVQRAPPDNRVCDHWRVRRQGVSLGQACMTCVRRASVLEHGGQLQGLASWHMHERSGWQAGRRWSTP